MPLHDAKWYDRNRPRPPKGKHQGLKRPTRSMGTPAPEKASFAQQRRQFCLKMAYIADTVEQRQYWTAYAQAWQAYDVAQKQQRARNRILRARRRM